MKGLKAMIPLDRILSFSPNLVHLNPRGSGERQNGQRERSGGKTPSRGGGEEGEKEGRGEEEEKEEEREEDQDEGEKGGRQWLSALLPGNKPRT